MPIRWRADTAGGWVEVIFTDPYTLAESEQVMKEIFADSRLTRPLRLLVNVRQSTPPDTNFVVNATTFWQLHIKEMWGAKVAVVVATDRQFGMAQMSARTASSNELPFIVRVFQEAEWDEATGWLTLGDRV